MNVVFAAMGWLRRYLVVLLLLFALGRGGVATITGHPPPRPQHPPKNFEVSRTVTRLEWQPCSDVSEYEVDVCLDHPDFSTAMTRRIGQRNYFNLHDLKPGHRYFWRVRAGDRTSRVQTFRVADNAIKFF